MQDTRPPVIAAFIAFFINAACGYLLGFTFGLKHTGLALASSISSIVNFLILFYLIEKRIGDIKIKELIIYGLKITLISLLMGATAWWISRYADWTTAKFTTEKVAILISSIGGSLIVYIILARVLGIEELKVLKNMLTKKAVT